VEVIIRARGIGKGAGTGPLLVTDAPLSFLGGVDPATGTVIDPDHPLHGQSISGRVLVFPHGKGSTVGSYVLYGLARNGVAPAAIVNGEAETIIAAGALIAGIPLVDRPAVPIADLPDGAVATVDADAGEIRVDDP
jgi:predicted aconitase with swiveling domain